MASIYTYQARTRGGKQVRGTIESKNVDQAVDALRLRGYLVTDIRVKRPWFGLSGSYLLKGAPSKELALFCRQLATMSAAGLELVNALVIIEEQHPNPRLRRTVSLLAGDIVAGCQLAEALGRHQHVFPAVLVHMVAAGETGGILAEVLGWMADHFEKEQNLRERVKGALTYPGVITLVAIAAVIFLVTFVLPTFTNLFTSSGLPLPWPTRLLLCISRLVTARWYWFVGSGMFIFLAAILYLETDGGRLARDRALMALPGVGPVILQVGLARICRTLGTLLAGGVPLLTALRVVKNTAGNKVITRSLEDVETGVQKGSNLTDLFAGHAVFPPMMVQMVAVGEKTGTLAATLVRIADYYEREIDYALTRFSSFLEPILILLVSGVIGFIVISIMLPLIELVTIIG